MKICAITGSTGILGKRVLETLPFKFSKFRGNIANFKEVKHWIFKNEFDLLIHLAAKVPTKQVQSNFKKALKINHIGTKNIVEALKLKKNKPEWVFFASTSHVYKLNHKKVKTSEKEKLNPLSKYGFTKKKAENEIMRLKNMKIKYCIGRIFSFTDTNQKKPFVIPSIINKFKKTKKKEVVLKNLNHYRDFISTKNISKIILSLYNTRSSGTFNIGSGNNINIKDIAILLAKKYKKKIKFQDNKIPTFLISDNRKILKKKIKIKPFKKNLKFFYN